MLHVRSLSVSLCAICVGAAAPALGDVSFNFNAGDGGFTSTLNTAAFDGPWVYGAAAGAGGTGGWSTNGQQAEINHACTTDLTSPVINVTATGPASLSFDHRFSFEFDGTRWDGGAVFVSVNGGAFTQLPAASFSVNGYIQTVAANSASQLAGQAAFTGASAGYANNLFINSVASLGLLNNGDTIQVRFRAASDTNTSGGTPNWAVDNISVAFVPSPGTVALLGLGGLTIARRRR